ncbi:helix-turn-helix transcriptional regulator [Azospirillum sp. RWY-5-1]|uniref:Helix-turn-helix transcriptional regulator n=1 Tax=Azospirillum oleiclasticum TaxID=2735135 RepID=A0ABX2T9A3_9PROT|nr:helix-turn-helix transcriptional regulator [Azospirillum oleiclasticum]NYZ12553.1 helix-turn-helix transcriptional regulator [Azospirillum oleiclasticum]NYZ19713.1 helix-turn-helix transcriptional regulator [Azospirillum oleiclasticum]
MPELQPSTAIGHAIDGPTVAVFTVALKAEFSAPAHRHPRGQLVGCSRGAVTILTELGAWVVPAGHAIWLPPDQLHGGQSFGPGAGWSVYVAPRACRGLPDRPRTVRVPGLLREAVLRAAEWGDEGWDEARQRIADLIVDEIGRLPAEGLDLPMPRDPRLQRVARAILEHPGDDRGIAAWAALAHSTPRTLSRRFPLETGLSFTDWRQRARMLRALELLAEGHAVTTIALDLGYSSVSGFIALFRRSFGVTPTAHPIGRGG